MQGGALFVLYLLGIIVFTQTRSLEHFWSGIFDPLGALLLDDISRYWTVAEQNTRLLPWNFSGYSPGIFLYNRLLWSAVGVASLAVVYRLFPMSVEALTAASQGRRAARARIADAEEQRPARSFAVTSLPAVKQLFGSATTWAQFGALTRLRLRSVLREIPFWALVGMMIVLCGAAGLNAGRLGDENVWPVTYLMLSVVRGNATLFLIIIAGFYSGELIWRERDTRFAGIHDALPIRESTDFLSRLIALVIAEGLLLVVVLLIGVLMQTVQGYHHYEIGEYVRQLFFITLPELIGFTLIGLFVQTIVSNKFIGYALVVAAFILPGILFNVGLENTLYLPGRVPDYIYSDMNGFGHFVPAIAWSLTYWLAIFGLLGVFSIAFARRGADDSLRARTLVARGRIRPLLPAAALLLLIAAGSGAWYYYNAHVLNEFLTAKQQRDIQAGYERQFKRYELLPQPKVTAVDTAINIYPERRSFDGTGAFTLQNKTGVPIPEIHITDTMQSVSNVQFDRPFHLVSRAPRDLYSIYHLETPLQPGEVVTMRFKVAHSTRGFRDGGEPAAFAYNGTFFDGSYFPHIGYEAGAELDDPRRRREEKLPPVPDMAQRGDPTFERINLFTSDSDWITYHAVLSTSADQIAISPGYLQRAWTSGGRHFYEYSMGATHILDFYNFVSGRYALRSQVYRGPNGPVNLEVYYDPAHTYDIDDMLAASAAGLNYYQAHYSPYQFSQYRIMEFPRYRQFAQSFPNTVPFSEAIGFIGRMDNPKKDVDLTYFVTAHELGHQWWGHQLIGGRVQGSNMMAETLAQYSAYMVMQQKYGKDYMRLVLRHFLDRYLRGRATEQRKEEPLALVQRESYVWYEKGGQIMYTLADYIGEDKMDLALHNFLMQYRYANANNQVDAVDHPAPGNVAEQPYPDTRMLVAAIRQQTPPELQYMIDDGFNRIVLYDNKALSAVTEKQPDGRYKVTLELQARKSQADGNGNETRMALNDFIEVGIFSGSKDDEKPLFLQKMRMTAEHNTYTILVDRKPTRAGIDPYNKLIDRISDDNVMDVTSK